MLPCPTCVETSFYLRSSSQCILLLRECSKLIKQSHSHRNIWPIDWAFPPLFSAISENIYFSDITELCYFSHDIILELCKSLVLISLYNTFQGKWVCWYETRPANTNVQPSVLKHPIHFKHIQCFLWYHFFSVRKGSIVPAVFIGGSGIFFPSYISFRHLVVRVCKLW
jgi:hypothetical protein